MCLKKCLSQRVDGGLLKDKAIRRGKVKFRNRNKKVDAYGRVWIGIMLSSAPPKEER